MAAIPKGRIVLYVVLGVIVIVVGIFVLTTSAKEKQLQAGHKWEVEDVARFVKGRTEQCEDIEQDLSGYTGPEVDEAMALLAKAREGMTQMQSLTDANEITAKSKEVGENIKKARAIKNKLKRGK
uniref:Uncharacterized protein n=1 Tax=candidate division WOR-3 bacterium TaxID=2052148 RepID=A0A7C4GE16_UNCW3